MVRCSFISLQFFEVLLSLVPYVIINHVSFLFFIQKGADANLANDGGRTALHYASSKGWSKVAEILVNHGAKINKKDKVYIAFIRLHL